MNTPPTIQSMTDRQARIKASRAERFRIHQEKEAAKKCEAGFFYRLENEGAVLCGCEQPFRVQLEIPETLGGQKVYKIEAAFQDCKELRSLAIPASVSEVTPALFGFCISLEAFEVSKDNPSLCSREGVLFSKDMKHLLLYPQAKAGNYSGPEGVTIIRTMAFECCHGLTAIKLPEETTQIGESAFAHCVNLKQVTLPSRLEEIASGLFSHCLSLSEINLPETIKTIQNGAFAGCARLRDVVLPTNLVHIGTNVFEGCPILLDLPATKS